MGAVTTDQESSDRERVHPQTIGVLSSLVGGFYAGEVVAGIDAVATRHGARVLAVQVAEPWAYGRMEPAAYVPVAWAHFDGLIVIANTLTEEGLQLVAAGGKPLVTVSVRNPISRFPSITPDNRGGAAAAVRHLLGHGHRRIAFVGWLDQEDPRERYEGYRAALLDAGISPDPALFFAASDCLEVGGREAAEAMLAAGVPCTAIMAATDSNAIGAMLVLQEAGYRVPEDVAIIGFDDIDLAQYSEPPLSSVRQSFSALGGRAAEHLLAILAGKPVPSGTVLISTTAVYRRSCGCTSSPTALPSLLPAATSTNWPAWLADQLAAQFVQPSSPNDRGAAEQPRTSIGVIAAALDATLRDVPWPGETSLDDAWRSLCAATTSAAVLGTDARYAAEAGSEVS